ncbi:MAG: hypothetical protein JXB49_18655 [Bacteroidales bacterium]|nr:hypothetical protein [Bacteroidales bacterium]
MITFTTPKHHWNYYLALEKDLENLSRYIEFCNDNLQTYSIELTHLLLSASSEIDVIMKEICEILDSTQNANNINDYRQIVKANLPDFVNEEIWLDRFSLSYKPWINWTGETNPDWWRSYNNVKHQRNNHYNEANLQNTINAIGALLLTTIYYYKLSFSKEAGNDINFLDTNRELQPNANFLRINEIYYYSTLIV